MARTTKVILTDDVNGELADETITFALDGVTYEIDLTAENAGAMRDAFAPWVGAGRRLAGRTARSSGGRSRPAGENAEIRAWARANGFSISERGRIPGNVIEAYRAR